MKPAIEQLLEEEEGRGVDRAAHTSMRVSWVSWVGLASDVLLLVLFERLATETVDMHLLCSSGVPQ